MNLRITRASRRHRALICAAVALVASSHAFAASTGDPAVDSIIAERLALIADDTANFAQAPEPFLRQAAAMLDIARDLNPKEVRFARSSASVLLRLGESDRALAALTAVRTLDPKDQLAMIQFIDLTGNAMESADAREAYLQQVMDANGVAPEVRAHAAVSLMDLLYERAEDSRAGEVLNNALTLNPQNIAALSTKYKIAVAGGKPLERAQALAALLQASPVDPAWISRAAHECVAAADYDGARAFFELLLTINGMAGRSPTVDDVIDISGSELLGGSAADIVPFVKQALEAIKDDGRLYAIDLLISQFNGSKLEELAPAIASARGVYLAQLAGVSQLINKPVQKEMPATSPAAPFPDVAADAAKLSAADPAGLKTAYTVALAEQLWFDLYFRAAPVDDAAIGALATLLGNDSDPLVVRLQGWKLLSAGKVDEARVKLSAVADRDGYAKLGLAATSLAQGKADEGKATLVELLGARPTGMLAVYAGVAGKAAGVKAPPTSNEEELARTLAPVRRPISDLLKNPRSAYLLSASPVNVSFGPGEVLLARVTIQNTGRQPLTIGPGGLVQPQFMIDLQTRGDAPRNFPAVASGTWAGAVRLMPQQSNSQIVRLDRGQANAFFRQYPTPLMSISAAVTSNPAVTKNGTLAMAGGQQSMVGNMMERRASPLFVEAFRTKVIDRIANGTPAERLTAMELCGAVLPLLDKQADNADAKSAAQQLRAALDAQMDREPIPAVKAWAMMTRGVAVGGAEGGKAIEMLSGMDAPIAKTAALIMGRGVSREQRQQLAKIILGTTPDGPVAEFAHAVADQPDPPPQPATAPAATPSAPSGQ